MEKEDGMVKQEDSQEKSPGQYLKKIREGKGISLREVAEETKIRVHYLRALEGDDYASLPGEVYARGFLRNYARFLGIPADEMSQFKPITPPEERGARLQQPVIQRRSKPRKPRRWLSALLLIFGIAVVAFFLLSYFVGMPVPDPEDNGRPNGDISDGILPNGEGDIAGEGENEEEPPTEVKLIRDTEYMVEYSVSGGPIVMEVRVGQSPCWLRVAADGNVIGDETLQPGEVREYRAAAHLQGRAGNPGSLSIVVNGLDVGVVGKQGIPKDFSFSLE